MNSVKKFVILGVFAEFLYLSFYVVKARIGDTFSNPLLFVLLMLLFLYVLGFNLVKNRNVSVKLIIFFGIVFNLSLLFLWKLPSDDIYTLIYWSRIQSIYGANPYIVTYDQFPNDAFYNFLNTIWSSKTVIYGPVILLLGSVLSSIAGDNLFSNLFLFKTFIVFLNISCIFLISEITRNKKALYLYSWSPIVLFELALNNRHDIFLLFFLLLSFYYILIKKGFREHLLGWILLIISVFTKFFSAIFAPFVFLYSLNIQRGKKKKFLFFILAPLITFFLIIILYFPFWEGPEIFNRLTEVYKGHTIALSPGIALVSGVFSLFNVQNAVILSKKYCISAFLVFYVFLFFKYLKSKDKGNKSLLQYLSIVLAMFFVLCLGLFLPWYLLTLIALLVLLYSYLEKSYLVYLIFFLSFYSVFLHIYLR